MRKCRKPCLCSDCPDRRSCPSKVRLDKRARRPLALSASPALLRRAAAVLGTGWYTVARLGEALYGRADTHVGRKSAEVRARRPVNLLLRRGFLITRPVQTPNRTGTEYTISPEGLEALGC